MGTAENGKQKDNCDNSIMHYNHRVVNQCVCGIYSYLEDNTENGKQMMELRQRFPSQNC